MDVTPHELRTVELREAWRGYRPDDVDELLDRVAGTIERLQAQVERLSGRLTKAEGEAGLGREADEMLRRTLLLAQRTADAAVSEAQERARRVVSESEAHAHSIVSTAEEEARRIAIAERQRIENEIRELSRQRNALVADVEALEEAARDHRRRLRDFLTAELARVDARSVPEGAFSETAFGPEASEFPPPAGEATEEFAHEQAESLTLEEAVEAPVEAPVEDAINVIDEVDEIDAIDEFDESIEDRDPSEPVDLLPAKRRRWRLREPEPDIGPPDDRFFDELRQAVQDDTPLGPSDALSDERDQSDDQRART
ncbi:MAG: DivIVA domain-containing protein [Actinobacteria bacterium]|nr:DivIVA domain-containing protein [Actinomycetota bacterium]